MIATLIRMLTGVQARFAGDAEPDGAKSIYFANHTSNLDGPVIWASLPSHIRARTRPIAARDYWDGGPIRRYLANRVFRCVLIERKKVSKSNNPLVAMEAALDAGDSLIIFPEGGRTSADAEHMGEFKPGLWHLARKHPTVRLVPVRLENLNRILPKGDFLFIPLVASATFGEPIAFDPDKDRFMQRARQSIENMQRGGCGETSHA